MHVHMHSAPPHARSCPAKDRWHTLLLARYRACVADLVTEKALHKKYTEFIQHFSNPPGGNPLARWAYNRRGQQLKVQCVAMT